MHGSTEAETKRSKGTPRAHLKDDQDDPHGLGSPRDVPAVVDCEPLQVAGARRREEEGGGGQMHPCDASSRMQGLCKGPVHPGHATYNVKEHKPES